MLNNQDFTQERTKYLGGSDIGAILGLSKYRTPLDVWLEKTGKVTSTVKNLPVRFGSFAEEFVAREYANATGYFLQEYSELIRYPEHPYLAGHIDRYAVPSAQAMPFDEDGRCVATHLLECKTANPFTQSQWGPSGSDEVPMSYLAQCHWYLCLTQLERCDLAVLFGNTDFRIYQIFRDLDLESALLEKAIAFWTEHVQADQPPSPQSTVDCQTLFRTEVPGKSIEAQEQTAQLIANCNALNQEIDAKEKEVEKIKQDIMSTMQEAQELTYQGQLLATWKKPKDSLRFDSKRFEIEHPELYPAYQTPIQSNRRLVIKEWRQLSQSDQGESR